MSLPFGVDPPEPFFTVWSSGAVLIAAAGFMLLAWALFADRSRGRLRCPRCWYDLGGTPAADDGTRTCPECGCTKLTERRMRRTRRRWRIVPVALLALLAADQLRRVPALREHGWVGLVPTTAIIPLAPVQSERWVRQTLGGQYDLEDDRWAWIDDLREELGRRDSYGESWRWQGSAWAMLAAWRPFAHDDRQTRSLSTAGIWWAAPCELQPFRGQRQSALVDQLLAVVDPYGWLDNGGDTGTLYPMGDRILIISTAEVIEECRALLREIREPVTVGAAYTPSPSSLHREDEWVRVVFDLRTFVPPCSDSSPSSEMVGWAMMDELIRRTSPDDWVDNGGDGIGLGLFEGRLILRGQPDLVAAAAANLRSSIDAALAEMNKPSADTSDTSTP